MNIKVFIVFFFLSYSLLNCKPYTIFGVVKDAESKIPISGATIKVVNKHSGSYSSTRGKFKIPFLNGKNTLKIMSIGYKSKYVKINEKTDSVFIFLEPAPVKLGAAQVIGKIEVNEIIKRAIKKKNENLKKIKTFSGLLYSKLVMELNGSIFGKSDSNSFSISVPIGNKAPEKYKMFVMETFSRKYMDIDKNIEFTEILQRRQTANIKPNNNIISIGNFFSLYDDRIKIIDADIVTPLGKNAFNTYKFKLIDRKLLDDRYIYIIKLTPLSDLFPAFEGEIKIVEGTYNLIEADLKPSNATAIQFIDSLHLIQKFNEVKKNIWYPSYLKMTGIANVEIIKGLIDVNLNFTANSIYSEMTVNEPLPDSIYKPDIKKLTVSPLADSTSLSFWENNSLRDITPKEKLIYKKVDSLVKKSDSLKKEKSDFHYRILMPYLDFNRVSSVSLGLMPSFSIQHLSIYSTAAYSFGLKKPIGEIGISYKNFIDKMYFINLSAETYSKVGTIGFDNSFPRIASTFVAGLFHWDYYDYYKKDGWKIKAHLFYRSINIDLSYEQNRNYTLRKTTDRAAFNTNQWRTNPQINNAQYNVIQTNVFMPISYWLDLTDKIIINANANYLNGENTTGKNNFNRFYSNLYLKIPTFNTGYSPMNLEIKLEYGSSKNLPIIYQHKMKTNLLFIGLFGNFHTAPLSFYESSDYYAGHFNFHLTDIWWRWLGLPMYQKRGLDLIFTGSTGLFPHYLNFAGNQKNYYTELGFGLNRIPTFISNIIYFGAGVHWGIPE